jgi:hypothetical protein
LPKIITVIGEDGVIVTGVGCVAVIGAADTISAGFGTADTTKTDNRSKKITVKRLIVVLSISATSLNLDIHLRLYRFLSCYSR